MSEDFLQQVQTLQFTDKPQAEALLLAFVRETFALDVTMLELRPLAVSLNSFNGFMTLDDGKRLFFKTHTEPDSVIGEYYNAAMLAEAGYPVIQPIFSSKEAGKQFLVYEVIEDPSVFDVAWAIENGQRDDLEALAHAQHAADDQLLTIYQHTLAEQSAEDAARTPVHQLFYHRITGGRLERFYGALPGQAGDDVSIKLPSGEYSMQEVRHAKWAINGQQYVLTLDDLIQQAIQLLNPSQAGPSIIGHGDAHNGNVFFRGHDSLLYFDPAFAGRHHPLLDLTKPLFHNVFAMWLYFPLVKRDQTRITLDIGDVWHVEHDYALHPVRAMFLHSKVERVLIPTLRELKQRSWLRADWRDMLKASLFCCPFLTMNLTDSNKFPPEISLLGLSMAVEMGGESREVRSQIDRILDQVEKSL
jgi:Phosphotransferase enzyme family